MIPVEGDYEHNRLNHDTNSHPSACLADRRIRAGPGLWGRMLGTWQQLVLIDFDDRPRERTVIVQVVS